MSNFVVVTKPLPYKLRAKIPTKSRRPFRSPPPPALIDPFSTSSFPSKLPPPLSDPSMANSNEASPLLNNLDARTAAAVPAPPAVASPAKEWPADGFPLVIGEPAARSQWDSSLCACLGRNDEFCSSDLEVCLLGSFAPCVLYGSNVERIGSAPGSFTNNCLPYTGLYMLGNSLFGWNCLAPWFSYPSRTAIRRKFNLEGSCETFSRSCGCFHGVIEDEVKREAVESACDFATHFFCHTCSLCQEGRELRRRMPHPGFNGRSFVVMMPPMEQTMGRGRA